MSVFRPSNINKRLVGTARTTGGSPGNGGQIGPQKNPYCGGSELRLGSRYQFGCNTGVFKIMESRCGRKECCQCTLIDCKGFFICCGPSTAKWFVSPYCTQAFNVSWSGRGAAVTCANSLMGSCGWFIPSCAQMYNPGWTCRQYWDCGTGGYWTDTLASPGNAWNLDNWTNGSLGQFTTSLSFLSARALRCTPT